MKLYYHPISSFSQKALMAFHEKGVEFEPQIVQLMDPQARAEYRKVYPLGKVPLVTLEDGNMIPESAIIIEFLDTNFDSGQRLIPEDPDAARRARLMERLYDQYLNESIASLLFASWKPPEQRDEEDLEKAVFESDVMYNLMEAVLSKHDWSIPEGFTMADCAAAPALLYAQRVKPFADRPAIAAYWERLSARPSWQRVMAEAAPYLERLPG